MKAVAAAILAVGMLSNSMLALGEDPVPFRSLMTTAGEAPSISALNAAQDNSAAQNQPTQRTHMTRKGKVMTGVGIGLAACGGFVLVGTAALNGWETSSDKAGLYGGGIALIAGGGVLIVVGTHQRAAR